MELIANVDEPADNFLENQKADQSENDERDAGGEKHDPDRS
jgi:hypothetical protein